jgi:hypothetical protein
MNLSLVVIGGPEKSVCKSAVMAVVMHFFFKSYPPHCFRQHGELNSSLDLESGDTLSHASSPV